MKRTTLKLSVIAIAALTLAGFAWNDHQLAGPAVDNTYVGSLGRNTNPDEKSSAAAFKDAAAVFFSARCANCHPAGDIPTQGDEMTPHGQGVTRGDDGKGVFEMRCTTCHQAGNIEGEHLPPGVPDWHMPPANQKMVFQGLTAGQLCRQLKDPAKNGGRKTPLEAVHHIESDPLVLWAWSPGNGRTKPPLSYEDFKAKMNEWIAGGAACPE